jgi:hypothetical protein
LKLQHLTNDNTDQKRARSGKDNQVESTLKIWFSNVHEKNASINGPLVSQKAEELPNTMDKEQFRATDGLTGGKSKRILCTSVCMVQKKCRFFSS